MKNSSKLPIMELIFHTDCSLESPRKSFNILFMVSSSTESKSIISTPLTLRNTHLQGIPWTFEDALQGLSQSSSTNSFGASCLLPLDMMESNTLFTTMLFFYPWLLIYPHLLGNVPTHDFIWRLHGIFLFSLGTSSLTFLCSLDCW